MLDLEAYEHRKHTRVKGGSTVKCIAYFGEE
jgi:hypothetical protein